jgi:cold shock CspA family protein
MSAQRQSKRLRPASYCIWPTLNSLRRDLEDFTRDEPSIIKEVRLPAFEHSDRMASPTNGFIKPESGENDVFVYIKEVQRIGLDSLREGQVVESTWWSLREERSREI